MATERKFLFAFVIALNDGLHFVNLKTTIDGDLEASIEQIKRRMAEDLAHDGIRATAPVLTFALQLDNIRPPEWVELPTGVRQSLEQVLIDHKKGQRSSDATMLDIWRWLYREA